MNPSTTWENLQTGDRFLLGGILASACIHSKYWRDLYIASHPPSATGQAITAANMQLWLATQPVPRKWAEKLVRDYEFEVINIIL